ncbi:ATP-grasp domain-containing protein [Clostridium hydrogenum]|uniref:ATP-grasp domain-containing protein n=1 Tax=Clostridium hydrogenum TaxID=2855764 RepID=UPI001F439537|nr:ATP-grasp domain-containing protein [Clostridium hydrogenum]
MNLKVLWTISDSMGTVSDLKMLKLIKKDFNIDVITADREDKTSLGFAVTGKKYIIPNGAAPDYIEKVIAICKKEKITTLIPQYGDELVTLSRNLVLFNNLGIKVLVTPDVEKLTIANSKTALYEYFSLNNFIPKYKSVNTLKELENAIFELGYPKKPVCMKPAESEGSKGFHIITNEKIDILNERPGSAKISWELLKNQLQQYSKLPKILVMEYLPGTEYSVDCVCKDGETIMCIPRQRVETSMGVAIESILEKNTEIMDMSKKIIKALNLSYNINIQFKYSSEGKPMLIEINPRVSGSLVANLGAGVNMLELALKLAYGLPLPAVDVKWGTRMMRYLEQLYL